MIRWLPQILRKNSGRYNSVNLSKVDMRKIRINGKLTGLVVDCRVDREKVHHVSDVLYMRHTDQDWTKIGEISAYPIRVNFGGTLFVLNEDVPDELISTNGNDAQVITDPAVIFYEKIYSGYRGLWKFYKERRKEIRKEAKRLKEIQEG